MKPLINSADDYAQSAQIDNGILALIARGRLTATSCLTMSPRWPSAATRLLPAIRQQADIGLHLDFTQFGAYRWALPTLIARTVSRSLSISKIESSIHQQLDHFEQALAAAPDYVDGHQHVHQLPQIRDVLLEVLMKRYSGNLPWLRIARPPSEDGLKAGIIKLLGSRALAAQATRLGFKCSGHLLGVYGFDLDGADYLECVHSWLSIAQRSPHIDSLMCHPAMTVNDSLVVEDKLSEKSSGDKDTIYRARLGEFTVINSTEFLDALQQHGIRLARGSEVLT